jgi:hypothetical protein
MVILIITFIINRSCHDDLQQSRRPSPAHHHHRHLLPRRHHELRRQGCSSLSLKPALLPLPTGRLFGRITQKGPNKSIADAQISGRPLAGFAQCAKCVLLLSNSTKVQEILYFSHSCFLKPECLQKSGKLLVIRIFFRPDCPESSA